MPWTSGDAKKHIKGLTSAQASAWASIANSALASCKKENGSDCEGKAVRIANSKAKQVKTTEDVITEVFNVKKPKWKDIETVENEDGLLIKEIPVFRTGTHKGNKYDSDFIDNKIIKQFKPSEDIPLQADHSGSWNSTLGWVKKIYRKGKMLYADLLLSDDNAITRWKKGLMKKWSVSLDRLTGKLSEISAVAFPYVKEAAVHGEVTEVGMARDHEVEEISKGDPLPKREVVEIDAHKERPEAVPQENSSVEELNEEQDEVVQIKESDVDRLKDNAVIEMSEGVSFSITSKGTPKTTSVTLNGKSIKGADDIFFSMYGEYLSIRYTKRTEEKGGVIKRQSFEYRTPRPAVSAPYYQDYLDNLDSFTKWTQSQRNDLPDSSFALVKRPVKDKVEDRALPYKDANGKIDPAYVRNALARINQVEGFSAEAIAHANRLLTAAAKKAGINISEEHAEIKMSEEKKTDVKESELLKEAMETQTKLSDEVKTKTDKMTKMNDDIKAKDTEIKEFKVNKEIDELKGEGKVIPAQEEKLKTFMLTLDDDKRTEFVKILREGKEAVKLGETGAQESNKEETKFDLEKMSVDDIEAEIKKYAKDNGVPEEDARDIFYEKYSK